MVEGREQTGQEKVEWSVGSVLIRVLRFKSRSRSGRSGRRTE